MSGRGSSEPEPVVVSKRHRVRRQLQRAGIVVGVVVAAVPTLFTLSNFTQNPSSFNAFLLLAVPIGIVGSIFICFTVMNRILEWVMGD